MGKHSRKRPALLLAALLLLGSLSLPVSADYENTYVNTGDQRADIIGVALTQVGYTEGPNNDTKYGDAMSLSNQPWCSIFISWCARQAGVPTSVLKDNGFATPSGFGLSAYYSGSEYTPKPGDLFFKKNFNHAGLVYYVEGSSFYTVEGNTSASYSTDGTSVMIQKRTVNDYYFASPDYTSDSQHSYAQHFEQAHPHKEYYQCTHCAGSYYTSSFGRLDTCRECIREACRHSYSAWEMASQEAHKRVCTQCGEEGSESHNWQTDRVTAEATCGQAGSRELSCSVCGAQRTDTVPATGTHLYSDWTSLSQQVHTRSCSVCGQEQQEEHTAAEGVWQTDAQGHWLLCSLCGEKLQQQSHQRGSGCTAPCEICGYAGAAHRFSSDCAAACLDCGFTRQAGHSFPEIWESDSTGHWRSCGVCGIRAEEHPHTPGPAATEEAPQNCSVCGFQLAARLAHIHQYTFSHTDAASHTGSCACGQVLQAEPHSWDMGTGRCTVCGAQSLQIEPERNWDVVWYVGAAVLAAALAAGVICLLYKRKAQTGAVLK